MKKLIKPLLIPVIYLVLQGMAAVVMIAVLTVIDPESAVAISGDKEAIANFIPVTWMCISMIITGVLTVLIASAMKLINWGTTFKIDKKQAVCGWLPFTAGLAGLIAITLFCPLINLPDILKANFDSMSHSTIGVFTLCLIVPVVEELCFREVIIGSLVRKRFNPWVAIIISSILFGLAHCNPAQILFGGMMGIVLGIIYYKSGNIVLPSVLHILNNSVSTIQTLAFNSDAELTESMSGNTTAIIICSLSAAISIILFIYYWKKYPSANLEGC